MNNFEIILKNVVGEYFLDGKFLFYSQNLIIQWPFFAGNVSIPVPLKIFES